MHNLTQNEASWRPCRKSFSAITQIYRKCFEFYFFFWGGLFGALSWRQWRIRKKCVFEFVSLWAIIPIELNHCPIWPAGQVCMRETLLHRSSSSSLHFVLTSHGMMLWKNNLSSTAHLLLPNWIIGESRFSYVFLFMGKRKTLKLWFMQLISAALSLYKN